MQATSAQERLLLLREMTRTWGTVDADQILQLRLWGLMSVDGATSLTLKVDVEGWRVSYDVTAPADATPAPEKLGELARSARWLLGEGWDVELRVPAARWGYREDGDAACRTRTRKRL